MWSPGNNRVEQWEVEHSRFSIEEEEVFTASPERRRIGRADPRTPKFDQNISVDLLDYTAQNMLDSIEDSMETPSDWHRRWRSAKDPGLHSYREDTLSEAATLEVSPMGNSRSTLSRPQSAHSRASGVRPLSAKSPSPISVARPPSAHTPQSRPVSAQSEAPSSNEWRRRRRRSPVRLEPQEGGLLGSGGMLAGGALEVDYEFSPKHSKVMMKQGLFFGQKIRGRQWRWIPCRKAESRDAAKIIPTPGPGHYLPVSPAVGAQDIPNLMYVHPNNNRVMASRAKRFTPSAAMKEISHNPAPCAYDIQGAAGSTWYSMRAQRHKAQPSAFFGTSNRLDLFNLNKVRIVDENRIKIAGWSADGRRQINRADHQVTFQPLHVHGL